MALGLVAGPIEPLFSLMVVSGQHEMTLVFGVVDQELEFTN